MAGATATRAFAVWFKDFHRWDYGFFRTVGWHWPASSLQRVGAVLQRKQNEVSTKEDKTSVPIIGKISFGGEVSLAAEDERADYKGRLFWAHAGDLIYSKIRVKQGSLAIVPAEFKNLAVSAEYPVYSVDETLINAAYLALVLKSKPFLALLEGLSHGGSTKTRIPPTEFERQLIPLPPLVEQKAIVTRWRKVQDEIAAVRKRVEKHASEIQIRFLSDLGLKPPTLQQQPRAFSVWWKDVERWGVQMVSMNALGQSKSPFLELPLLDLCSIGSGGTPSRQRPDYFGGTIPWVKTTEVRNEIITATEERLTEAGLKNSSAKIYPKGSLIVAMYGQGATRGRTAKLGIDATTNQACAVLSNFDPRIETDFLWYFLISQYDNLRALASGNNQPNLNAEMIANLRIPLPPLFMQKQIMERVAAGRTEIAHEREAAENLTKSIQAEIEALILGTQSLTDA